MNINLTRCFQYKISNDINISDSDHVVIQKVFTKYSNHDTNFSDKTYIIKFNDAYFEQKNI